ncbi:hypothetical protein PR003_g34517 [Phytophthora rubi]|uniref:Uncharacterized protein n=1 Tax=Phytophthora rubi TaxID=129364 RepID=A0A6A4AQR5_9STRA|nr:hypothetical protein PR003_g34517 [Phytophthora rubi]
MCFLSSWYCATRKDTSTESATQNYFFLWRADGDISFTEKLSGNFEWKADLNRMTEYERTVELGTINQLADRDDVNALMLKRHDMRARLDLVHARLGLSMLDKEGITADWDELLMEEESADSHSLRA